MTAVYVDNRYICYHDFAYLTAVNCFRSTRRGRTMSAAFNPPGKLTYGVCLQRFDQLGTGNIVFSEDNGKSDTASSETAIFEV